MGKVIISVLCATVLCSCGFFERKPLSEEEVKKHIFEDRVFSEAQFFIHSAGAVGGYSFVVKVKTGATEEVVSQLEAFELLYEYPANDRSRQLIIEMFESTVSDHFSGLSIPEWIPKETICQAGVSLYKKEKGRIIIYMYRGVGECDELFFFGSLD